VCPDLLQVDEPDVLTLKTRGYNLSRMHFIAIEIARSYL
jgi:hypothetical protein